MDDWITMAYPGAQTYRHPDVHVRHRLARRRYAVDQSHSRLLDPHAALSRERILAFLRRCRRRKCADWPPARPRGRWWVLRRQLDRSGYRPTKWYF